ncbi:MAG: sigma-54 dependent transcriptional regulator [Moraxella sp.]|nr:sigma-54 dependent transcriptional regulator [Moraxella sp.]
MQNKPIALIIDDEADLCRLMQITLNKMNIDSDVAYDIGTATEFLDSKSYDLCLTDLALPDGSGLDLVRKIADESDTPVAVISAHGDLDIAIEALKLGAFDFVNKPLQLPRLRTLVESALKIRADIRADALHAEAEELKKKAKKLSEPKKASQKFIKHPISPKSRDEELLDTRLIGESAPMQHLRATIKKLARSQAPVFLWGDSGTGKEVVSQLIHDLSPRRDGSFVPVNCGAIPSELMESEFFGHKKGSFTGAVADKIGLFQQADGGTLFLDEVADLPLGMQVKLLRAIQERTVRAVGDTKEVPVDVRILCATHKDLAELVCKGAFREDLFYRINVIEVRLPTLNERRKDIPQLAKHFLSLIAKDWQLTDIHLTPNAVNALSQHNYKGNVRELRNILERAVTLSDSNLIDAHHLSLNSQHTHNFLEFDELKNSTKANISNNPSPSPYYNNRSIYATPSAPTKTDIQIHSPIYGSQKIQEVSGTNQTADNPNKALPKEGLTAYLEELERQMILAALQKTNGNKSQAAQLLGINFRSLRYRMDKLKLENNE